MVPQGEQYLTDADCTNTIFVFGSCIDINLINIDIEEGSTPGLCDKDYLEVNNSNEKKIDVLQTSQSISNNFFPILF